jgi:hypothetical protein
LFNQVSGFFDRTNKRRIFNFVFLACDAPIDQFKPTVGLNRLLGCTWTRIYAINSNAHCPITLDSPKTSLSHQRFSKDRRFQLRDYITGMALAEDIVDLVERKQRRLHLTEQDIAEFLYGQNDAISNWSTLNAADLCKQDD